MSASGQTCDGSGATYKYFDPTFGQAHVRSSTRSQLRKQSFSISG